MLKWSIFSKLLGPRERRRDGRLECDHEVSCQGPSGACCGRLRQVSPQGARLEVASAFPAGELIQMVSSSEGWQLEARVAWCRNGELGLKFALGPGQLERVALPSLIRPSGAPRRSARVSADLRVKLDTLAGLSLGRGQAVDLSLKGARVLSTAAVMEGEPLSLQVGPAHKLPALTIKARVVRSRAGSGKNERLLHLRFFSITPERRELLERYLAVLSALAG